MNINKLAALANLLGGVKETSDLLEIDQSIIEKAVTGHSLGRRQEAELENAYNEKVNLDEVVDPREVDKYAEFIHRTTSNFLRRSVEQQNQFRSAVAYTQITPDELRKGYILFANLKDYHSGMILSWLDENTRHTAEAMIEAFLADSGDIWNIEDSEFWKWFRDTFY